MIRVVADGKGRQPCFMRNLKTIRREANGVAKAVNSPLGARPLQRVVSDHLGFFAGLRAEGASWEQIAALMASEGLRSRTGGVVSAGVLRALCSRAAKEASSATRGIASVRPASRSDTADRSVSSLVGAALLQPGNSSLAETIARVARLRGFLSDED